MENLRFKNKFDYNVQIDTSINPHDIEIPPMLLQPFIENAILHGLLHKEGPGLIQLTISMKVEMLQCTITDNGIGREADQQRNRTSHNRRKSVGMASTKKRLDILNQEQSGVASLILNDLKDANGLGCGIQVIISLPV